MASKIPKECMMKEIETIQGVINRMASNSFLIKGWAVTLVSVTLLLKGSNYQVFIAFIPLMTFWYLDAYFLRLERAYRKLYSWVISNRPENDEFLFNMDANGRFGSDVQSRWRIMRSETLVIFYGPILVIIIVYMLFSMNFLINGVVKW